MDTTDYTGDHWNRNSEDILHQKYPLHKACRDGDIESLSLMIVSGQHNPLQEDEFYGWTPAHWAAYFGKLACLRRIMQALSNAPSSSRYQQTPIHLAAYSGHPQCLHWLLRTGSNPNDKDYLGESSVHKAARTGSMECVGLMAAENADLLETNNVSLTPSELAARCGYADCALYLSRAADQQRLKLSGVIHEVQLPVISADSVLPGQVPDRCVIMQGLNGGKLPSSIDSFASRTANNHCGDMEMDTFIQPPTPGVFQANGHQNGVFQTNGHPNGVFQTNGHPNGVFQAKGDLIGGFQANGVCENGFTSSVQKDVTLCTDVSQNRVAIAGRKRGREQIDAGFTPEIKRAYLNNTDQSQPLSNGFSLHHNGITNGVTTNGFQTGQHDVGMDETCDTDAELAIRASVPESVELRHGPSVPYVDLEAVIHHPAPNFCSHAFYCSHKFKNAPCI